jgi:hypothetical protein
MGSGVADGETEDEAAAEVDGETNDEVENGNDDEVEDEMDDVALEGVIVTSDDHGVDIEDET